MEKYKSTPQHMLMEAIGFTEEDFEANREGRLSERQGGWYSKQQKQTSIHIVTIAPLVLYLIVCAWIIAQAGLTVLGKIAVIGLLGVITLIVVAFLRREWAIFEADLGESEVAAVEGIVTLNVSAGEGRTRHIDLRRRRLEALRLGKKAC